MRFENVFWDERSFVENGEQFPSILAIGDSWFWYPFPGGSLVNRLGRLVATKQHNVLVIGKNGAEAYDFAFGKYEKTVRTALKMHGPSTLGVFISGGGNDFAGFSDLRPLLRENCADATSAETCFNPRPNGALYRLMEKVANSYSTLIGRVLLGAHPEVTIFVHNYSYAIPTGIGVFGNASWLKAALQDAKVPEAFQQDCMRHVMDVFTEELEKIVALSNGKVVLVDSRHVLGPGDWANELHPTPAGFEKIAQQAWKPRLQAAGLSQ